MKKGFVENIEENTVVIFFEDNEKRIYEKNIFPSYIKQNMVVFFESDQLIKVEKEDLEIKNKVKELSNKLFKRFKSK